MFDFIYKDNPQKISSVLLGYGINYNTVMKLLRLKDIKVNGKRISQDMIINNGDEVKVYIQLKTPEQKAQEVLEKIPIVYEDDDILVLDKPQGIETTGENSLEELLRQKYSYISAVHRLDTNTKGLVIFAKNTFSEQILLNAFRERKIHKVYRAELVGRLPKDEDTLVAYLKKESEKSKVKVRADEASGYVKIITGYKVLCKKEHTTIADIFLYTGRTHQIRAHMGFIGHGVLGDGKYGNFTLNRNLGVNTQRLVAYKLTFDENIGLQNLRGKTIEIDSGIY